MASIVTYVLGVLLAAYLTHTAVTFYQLFNPTQCDESRINCIIPYMERDPKLQLFVFGSTKKSFSSGNIRREKIQQIWILNPFDINNYTERSLNVTIPVSVRNNGSYYLHTLLLPQSVKIEDTDRLDAVISKHVSAVSGPVTLYKIKDAETYHLMGSAAEPENKSVDDIKRDEKSITHWFSDITICVMSDNLTIPMSAIPMELYPLLNVEQSKGKVREYRPILYIDTFMSQYKYAVPVNSSSDVLPLTVKYQPISVGKLRLRIVLQQAMANMKALGFGDKDTDEIKSLLADTNLYLLLLTFVVSVFHLLFDFLAFKNDVQFWRSRKTMVGISSRTVLWRCISQMIILLYLFDQESVSLLVTIPNTIATFIEIWKVTRALKIQISWTSRWLPTIKFGSKSDQEDQTEEFDSQAMTYLSYVLYPLCISGAVYSLIYTPYKSWYSWCVSCLVNGVYAFGFLFMLPQLFLNYKLKSVAHLPWRAFMYKAFNTFIDDVFAFIITMPTAHRLACFRDDIIFVIYLYQRWLYPVDKKRANEFGQTFEHEDEQTDNKLKQE